ncbi:hypothetical protein LTR56_005251 [Elasticomyces elasticus]|nr:hypothetical protein LTR56_005251 [Elasticomyces elasticus]KAK3656481.1 hypothetical protein LTR22_009754 [Elasticomyces elasticus]KAK4923627.1 hypothetical protein LTR49_009182 [Elasticomyces elasticus]
MAAYYKFEDLSGESTPNDSDNPYDGLIEACSSDPAQIQTRYNTHRNNRNAQQQAKLLSPDFHGVTIDEILAKLEDPTIEPGFKDWRHCLVFWARPPVKVRELIGKVQEKLLDVAPRLWTMPSENLHMTALEITHSLTASEIDGLVEQMLPEARDIADHTLQHRARLVKPLLSFDAQALALSFLPAAGEPGVPAHDDSYTYHHLRRDLHAKASAAGVKVASRYVIPSAHLTIGRFITKSDFETSDGAVDHAKVERFIERIESINEWLQAEYWPSEDSIKVGGEWVVGEEKGLDFRQGALWYGGGGETVCLGQGF